MGTFQTSLGLTLGATSQWMAVNLSARGRGSVSLEILIKLSICEFDIWNIPLPTTYQGRHEWLGQ